MKYSDKDILEKYGKDHIISGHFPFRNLEMLQRQWRKEAHITRMEIDGQYSKSIQCSSLDYPELDKEVKGGYKADHAITLRFRFGKVLVHPIDGHPLNIQKIFQHISQPRPCKIDKILYTVYPSTLYIREFTLRYCNKSYLFKGKVPKELFKNGSEEEQSLLRKQLKEWKKKGDKDRALAVLDLQGIHSIQELLELEKVFPPKWFFKRICVNKPRTITVDKPYCIEIWNDGTPKKIGGD